MAEEKLIICDTDVLIDYRDSDSERHIISRKRIEEEIKLDNDYRFIRKLNLFNDSE